MRISGGGDEHAGMPVLIFHIGGHIVLHLDVLPLPVMHEGLHLFREPQDPLPEIQLMRALVQQHAAALAAPGGPPVPAVIIVLAAVPVGDEPVGPADPPVPAALDQLPHLPVHAVGPLIEHHREHGFGMLFRLRVHFPNLLRIDSGRLFAQHMNPPPEALDDIFRMVVVGNRDHAGVQQPAVQHGQGVVKISDVRRHVFPGPGDPVRIDVRDGNKLNVRNPVFPGQTAGIGGALIADADNTETDFFSHNTCLLIIIVHLKPDSGLETGA